MPKRTKAVKKTDQQKPWLKKPKSSTYRIDSQEVNQTILIITEGQTEKLYFESFPVVTLTVRIINLAGQSKRKLIEATEAIIRNSEMTFDKIWCVFDMDVKQEKKELSDFDNAINSGLSKGYEIAYSNDCFELWFYLHYHYTDQKNHRTFYYQFLSDQWNCNYEKEGKKYKFCSKIYTLLEDDESSSQQQAVKSAKKLLDRQINLNYYQQNPTTTVFKLVEFLNTNSRR